jgi:dTDP-4-amino-4,6-dideoxygalactose transaminase
MASIKKEIRFTEPTLTGSEIFDVAQCLEQFNRASYIAQCEALLESMTGCQKALLTPSCTSALELAAIVAGIGPGDEVIMPSYTFVSTANAFVLRGARIKYIDVRPDTLNIDETKIEDAINERTKAIVAVHYAGVSCEMHSIAKIAREYDLMLIEDAAQGIGATYQGSPLGSIGHLAAFSFHSTKNIHSGGEGGALLINDKNLIDRAMVVQEKGTNRHDYLHGKVNKYSWVSLGSSFLISEIQAAFLLSQLRAVLRTVGTIPDEFGPK